MRKHIPDWPGSAILLKTCSIQASKNKVAGEEEMLQINDLSKLLISLHDKCNELLSEEDQNEIDEGLDMVDEQIFTFKRRVHR